MLRSVRLFCFFLTFSTFLQDIHGLVPRAAQNGGPKASASAPPDHFQQAPTQAPQSSAFEQRVVALSTSLAHAGLGTITTNIGGTTITGLLTTVTPANKPTMVFVIPEVSVP